MNMPALRCAACNGKIKATKPATNRAGAWYHKQCYMQKVKLERETNLHTCGICGTPNSAKGNRPCKKCQCAAQRRIIELNPNKGRRRKAAVSSGHWSKDGSRWMTQNHTGKPAGDEKLRIPPVKVYSGGLCMPK